MVAKYGCIFALSWASIRKFFLVGEMKVVKGKTEPCSHLIGFG